MCRCAVCTDNNAANNITNDTRQTIHDSICSLVLYSQLTKLLNRNIVIIEKYIPVAVHTGLSVHEVALILPVIAFVFLEPPPVPIYWYITRANYGIYMLQV